MNCMKEHYATDKAFEKYNIECEIISTQNRESTSRIDAVQKELAAKPEMFSMVKAEVSSRRGQQTLSQKNVDEMRRAKVNH